MKNLIYTTAYGKPYYFEMAQEFINSCRKSGFDGDIVVLTDKPWNFVGAKAYPIEVKESQLWRCQLAQAVNPEEYDGIAYVDSDHIMISDPSVLFESSKICVTPTGISLGISKVTNLFLTLKEKNKYWHCASFCSGCVCFPGSIARAFLAKWEARWRSLPLESAPDLWKGQGNPQLLDEAALATLCFRDEIEWDYLPLGAVIFPSLPLQEDNRMTSKTVMAHFCDTSGTARNVLFAMRLFSDPSKRESVLKGFKDLISSGGPEGEKKMLAEIGKGISIMLSRQKDMEARLKELETKKEMEYAV